MPSDPPRFVLYELLVGPNLPSSPCDLHASVCIRSRPEAPTTRIDYWSLQDLDYRILRSVVAPAVSQSGRRHRQQFNGRVVRTSPAFPCIPPNMLSLLV